MMQAKNTSEPHSIPLLSDQQDDEEQQRISDNQPLYTPHPVPKRPLLNRYSWIVAGVLLILFIGLLAVPKPSHKSDGFDDDYDDNAPVPDSSGICKQMSAKEFPDDDISKALERLLESEDFRREATERLSGAVRIPTESYDDMGPVGEDDRWDVFQDFHDYLAKSYPKVYVALLMQLMFRHSRLKVEKVNTWGLVYTWNGSDSQLKPGLPHPRALLIVVLFMAHQDVVPVPKVTESDWKYPPWSGHYDGEKIWGRGFIHYPGLS